jgi:predicted flap endonuclease-1-like 5' DNA nuclease
MSTVVALIIGLLAGWIIEWIIDWIFWRRKNQDVQQAAVQQSRRRVADLEQEIASYKNQLANLQADITHADFVSTVHETERPSENKPRGMKPVTVHDHLEAVKGITPEMVQRLNGAGIETVADLAALRPQRLKEIFAGLVAQPGSEVEIIKQARLNSGMLKKVDNLEIIVGIGPVIARLLNSAGIFTFAELSVLTARDLRDIVGERIQRLANEEQILTQARQLAEEQNRGG